MIVESTLRRTWAEINFNHLIHNFNTLQSYIGKDCKFLGVVKADAYGHGALQVGKTLEKLGAAYLAVSSLDEAIELRRGGISMPILIFGHTPPEMVEQLIANNITQTVSARAKAEEYHRAAARCGGKLRVHIKVDTGMSRLGFLLYGAFLQDEIKGFAALKSSRFGSRREYIDLAELYVSQEVRGTGIGRRLFQLAKEWARRQGAEKLYLSAHSSIESQAFYRAVGCVEALEYNEELVRLEPCDCQLECSLLD